ncbi:hypothetical protein [Actinacidiphila epipremni]|uniref:Secreted protein n=1 Tax=Actinacidiphila epipremni TaxID=2053013 RepID=A0ABX0ZVM2_9ACTN|nr:hypothetical protein [Actinacidiphila epipremni]NJP48078.1 hypothetical protein [Actinacidiphila epipremni]
MAAVLAAATAAGAAGCAAAPAGPPATASPPSRGSAPPSTAAPTGPADAQDPPTDPVQEVLHHLAGPQDAPDAAGVTRIASGTGTERYFWETRGGRMCLAAASSASDYTFDCAGPTAAERDHQPELRALFGPGADLGAHFYLAFRIGHGELTSLTLAGKPVQARPIRKLGPQVGGGTAYFLPLTHWPDHEKLTATVSVDGTSRTLTMDVDL